MSGPRSFDVFCRVIDNFGDAGVCWRLSCALAGLPSKVRLWIDDPGALRALVPVLDERIEVLRWDRDSDFGAPADVAVDAFGGGLPEAYARAIAGTRRLWIVLEYLSAEPWVAEHHGLPSPHPRLEVERYFFFPGFEPGTGGLLREAGFDARRAAFLADPRRKETLWRDAGFALPRAQASVVTLFGYENPALAELLEAWAAGPQRVVAAVPRSRITDGVAAALGVEAPPDGTTIGRGSLEVRFLPFLAQDRFDELLWAADWNFVRGEDSFVRAQWAEAPLAWQIYVQEGGAHLVKLEAFLDLYCRGMEPGLAAHFRALNTSWNLSGRSAAAAPGALAAAWRGLSPHGESLRRHARDWAGRIAQTGDLARNLARFCSERLE
jgi:uncharacterized repeat protein (TIGR03837 family)